MSKEIEQSPLQKEISFGEEVEAFITSRVGKYLIARAEAEIAEALEALKTVDCTATQDIRALQNQVYRAESIQYWLAEAIQAGVNAEIELVEQQQP